MNPLFPPSNATHNTLLLRPPKYESFVSTAYRETDSWALHARIWLPRVPSVLDGACS